MSPHHFNKKEQARNSQSKQCCLEVFVSLFGCIHPQVQKVENMSGICKGKPEMSINPPTCAFFCNISDHE